MPIHLIRLAALSGAGEAVDGLGSSGARRTLSQGLKEKKERKQGRKGKRSGRQWQSSA